jgi:hypothetical protein
MQAGLKAGPVLMSLPAVPAWALANQSVSSACEGGQINPDTGSCELPNIGNGERTTEFADPFAPPGKGKDKKADKRKKGAFLESGNWLDD